jgi:hypothetical protein
MRRASTVLVVLLGLVSCRGGNSEGETKNVGQQVADITTDTAVMKEAQAASNQLIQNAGDCEAVKAALPDVSRKLNEAAGNVRTATGKATLDALRNRVAGIAQLCP